VAATLRHQLVGRQVAVQESVRLRSSRVAKGKRRNSGCDVDRRV